MGGVTDSIKLGLLKEKVTSRPDLCLKEEGGNYFLPFIYFCYYFRR